MGSPSMASSAARVGGRVLKTWQAAMWRRRVAWERYCDGRNRRREALPPRARACRSDRRRATTPAVASSRPSREECRKRRPETHRSGRGRFGSWATSGRWSPGRGFEGRDRSLRWGPSALASQPQRVAATGWGAVGAAGQGPLLLSVRCSRGGVLPPSRPAQASTADPSSPTALCLLATCGLIEAKFRVRSCAGRAASSSLAPTTPRASPCDCLARPRRLRAL